MTPRRLVGMTVPSGGYDWWRGGLGENYYNVADGADSIVINQWDAGKLPVIHLMFHEARQPGCTIDKIAAGDYDDLLDAWLLSLKAYCDAGRKAVVVYLPEFNGDWTVYGPEGHPTWGANPAAFIWSFNWFVLRARDHGIDSSMVRFCWAPNNYGWGTLEDWWPAPELVDLIGGSAYNWGGLYPGYEWDTPAELFGNYVSEVRGFTDKPITITQTGAGLNDPRTPGWLDQAVDYTNGGMIDGFIWFNIGEFTLGNGCDWNEQTASLDDGMPIDWFSVASCGA